MKYTTNERNIDNEKEKIGDDFLTWYAAQPEIQDEQFDPDFWDLRTLRAVGLSMIREYLTLLFSGRYSWNPRYCSYGDALGACMTALDI